jgi:hypothetical protein
VCNMPHALVLALAVAAWFPSAACFGGDRRDGGVSYDDPSDFDHGDCSGALDSIDPSGVWHADMAFPGNVTGTGSFRLDPDGGEFAAILFGRDTDDVRVSDDDLFIRSETVTDGSTDVTAIDLCQVREDGGLDGQVARCFRGSCLTGRVAAYPVPPLDDEEGENMTLLSEWAGSADEPWDGLLTLNVRHHGTVVYLARGSDGLRIIDLADPERPADLGHLPVRFPADEYYNDVKILETDSGGVYAFLASDLRGVVVADVTDPTDPAEVTAFPEPPLTGGGVNVHTLFVEGNLLYVANVSLGGLAIYDVADPAEPVRVAFFVHPNVSSYGGFVHDLSVQDGVAYLNYWNLGMVVVDAANPAAPAMIGVFDDYDRRTSHSNWTTEAGGRRIALHGDEDFDAHVRIVDVDPASDTAFQEIGSFQTRRQVSVHNIMAVGERALVTHYQDGLRVLDLADPTAPVEIAHFSTWRGTEPGYGRNFYEGAVGVDHDAERDLVLLADTHRGLLVLTLDL